MSLVNFAWVIGGVLARSGRPMPADYPWIDANFKEVISFEGEAEDWKEADGLAVPLLSMPIGFTQIYFTGISQTYLNAILGAIKQVRSGAVLVHCQHGEDRTGLIVAAYRVAACGWTKEAAMAEALRFGYHGYLNFGLNKTWRTFLV